MFAGILFTDKKLYLQLRSFKSTTIMIPRNKGLKGNYVRIMG